MTTTSTNSGGLLHLTILGPREKRAPIAISPQSTIRELLREIDALFPEFRHQRIRLLYGGRIVADDVKTLEEHRFTDGTAVHLHVTAAPRDPASAASLAAAERLARVALAGSGSSPDGPAGATAAVAAGRGRPADGDEDPELAIGGAAATAAGNAGPPGAADGAVAGVPVAGDGAAGDAAPVAVGFDRLAALGLDADEIAVVRAQFLPDVTREMSDIIPLQPGESERDRLRRMEDMWMRAQGPMSEFAMNLRPIILMRHDMGGGGELGAAAVDRQRFLDALRAERLGARRARGGGDDDDDDDDEPRPGRAPVGTIWALLGGAVIGSVFGFLSLLWVAQGSLSRNFRLGLVIGVMINIGVSSMSPAMQKDSAEKLADQITGGASGGGAAGGGSGGSSSGGGGLPSGPRVPVGLPDGAQLIGWRR